MEPHLRLVPTVPILRSDLLVEVLFAPSLGALDMLDPCLQTKVL